MKTSLQMFDAGWQASLERVAHWMMARSFATGHGDTMEDLLEELTWQIREQALRECAALMCGRCAAGEKPSYWDHDDYISNFGPVNAGDWIHPTSEDFDARYCDASYIHSAILAKLEKPAGAKHE